MPILSPKPQNSGSEVCDQTMLPISQLTNAYTNMVLLWPTSSNTVIESPLCHVEEFPTDISNKKVKGTNEYNGNSESQSRDKNLDVRIDLDQYLVKSLSPVDLILPTFDNTAQVVNVLDKHQYLGVGDKLENKIGMTTMSERTTQENNSINGMEAETNDVNDPSEAQAIYVEGQESPMLFSDQCDQSWTRAESLVEEVKTSSTEEKLVSCSNNGSTQNIIELNSMELSHIKNEQVILIESDSDSEGCQIKKHKQDEVHGSLPDKTEKSPKPCSYSDAIAQKHPNTNISTSYHQQIFAKQLSCSQK